MADTSINNTTTEEPFFPENQNEPAKQFQGNPQNNQQLYPPLPPPHPLMDDNFQQQQPGPFQQQPTQFQQPPSQYQQPIFQPLDVQVQSGPTAAQNPGVLVIGNNTASYYQQLLLQQQNLEAQLTKDLVFDVPRNWDKEFTTQYAKDQYFCFGEKRSFIDTSTLGRIEFVEEQCCECDCNECGCFGFYHRKNLLENIPSQTCQLQIEQCCSKTAIIRYKGVVIGKVERVISRCCSTSPKYMVKPIDNARAPFVLSPVCDILSVLNTGMLYRGACPRFVDILKNGSLSSSITNRTSFSCCSCLCPDFSCCGNCCPIYEVIYGKGDISFDPNLKDDEKVLLVAGWAILNKNW